MKQADRTRQLILNAHLENPELSNKQIAKLTGYSHTTVGTALKGRRITPNGERRFVTKPRSPKFHIPAKPAEVLWAKSGVGF